MKFVLLIHPIEVRRRIATGRMAHLSLENPELLVGEDFEFHTRVNQILNDPDNECVVLYPDKNAVQIDHLTTPEQLLCFDRNRQLVIFVIDGTWATSRKTIRSANLKSLPKICFTPSRPSTFRVRKQPAEGFYSTIEAVHQCIEIMGKSRGFDVAGGAQQALLDTFNWMVERQMTFSPIFNPGKAPSPRLRTAKKFLDRNAKSTFKTADNTTDKT